MKTLGLPKNNVRFYEDATYGNIIRAIETLKNIADVYEGDAAIIFYYAGLGATDAQTSTSYLLPTDANPSALGATGYSLQKLSDALAELNTRYSLVLIDAGFAGTDRNGQFLEKNRAVQMSSKRVLPRNKTIVLTASGSKETAFTQKELALRANISVSYLSRIATEPGRVHARRTDGLHHLHRQEGVHENVLQVANARSDHSDRNGLEKHQTKSVND